MMNSALWWITVAWTFIPNMACAMLIPIRYVKYMSMPDVLIPGYFIWFYQRYVREGHGAQWDKKQENDDQDDNIHKG